MANTVKSALPNILTLSRGFFVILISLIYFTNFSSKFLVIYLLFLLASISDYFDGKLARRWNVKSNFGIVFDSLFDKILTFIMYVLLIPFNLVHTGVFIALIFRDLLIDGIKNFSLSKGVPIPARLSGKLKMVFQTLLINFGFLSLVWPQNDLFRNLLVISAGAALLFSYYSGILYILDWLNPSNDAKNK